MVGGADDEDPRLERLFQSDHLKLAGKRGDGLRHSPELLHRKGKAASAICPPLSTDEACSLFVISSWSSRGSYLAGQIRPQRE